MTVKKSQSITKQRKPYKSIEEIYEYFNVLEMQMVPITEKLIDAWCRSINQWVAKEGNPANPLDFTEALHFGEWLRETGITWTTFDRMRKKWPQLAATYEYAMIVIGARRDKGAAKRRYNEATVSRSAGYYDYATRAEQDRAHEMKKASESSTASLLAAELAALTANLLEPVKKAD